MDSVIYPRVSKKREDGGHHDSLFMTPDTSIQLIHQKEPSNLNTLSQKNLDIIQRSMGGANSHHWSTSLLEKAQDPRVISSVGPIDVLNKGSRYLVQPMHLYAEQMRQLSDVNGALPSLVDFQSE